MTTTGNPAPQLLENGTRPSSIRQRIVDIWQYRELLVSLVRRELKIKYKDSILGFVWTLLNPLLYLVIYSIVFSVILKNPTQRFGLYLLSGLLVYNLFSIGVSGAATSITGNAALVQKVWFPREILPLAAIGANCVTFFFQLVILFAGLLMFQQSPEWTMLWLTIPAVLATLLLATGLGLLLSALNVYFRDVEHFLELFLMTWFWLTPIVYPYQLQESELVERWGKSAEWLPMLNPLTPIITIFQRTVYNPNNFSLEPDPETLAINPLTSLMQPTSWYLTNLGISFGVGFLLLFLGFKVFNRLEANLAEEL